MAQLMPLLLTVYCFSKIQIGFTFLVPTHPGSPGKRAIKRVCVCVLQMNAVAMQHYLAERLMTAVTFLLVCRFYTVVTVVLNFV